MKASRRIAALVRHAAYEQPADVPSAHLPHPLTAKGHEQASRVGVEILAHAREQGWVIDPVIDTSCLLRAWQTAKAIAAAVDAPRMEIASFETLCERSVGSAANLTIAQIEAIMQRDPRCAAPPPGWKAQREYRLPWPGAESLREAGERVAKHVRMRLSDFAIDRSAHQGILKIFVGHGGAFRHAAVTLGVLAADEAAGLSMHHASTVYFEHQSDDTWMHIGGAWKVRPSGRD